jgi:hypothetical protein
MVSTPSNPFVLAISRYAFDLFVFEARRSRLDLDRGEAVLAVVRVVVAA